MVSAASSEAVGSTLSAGGWGAAAGVHPSKPKGMGERWPCSASYWASMISSIMGPSGGESLSGMRLGTVSGVAPLSGGVFAETGSAGTNCTLRGAPAVGGVESAIGSGATGAWCWAGREPSRVTRSWRACVWVSVHGASGDFGAEFFKACKMSWRQFRMTSVEELSGSLTLVGNQVKVLIIWIARVSQIQML